MCPFIHLEFTRFPIPAHSPWDAKPLLAAKIVEVRDTSLASKLGPGISNMEFWNRTHGALRFYTKNSKPQGHGPCMTVAILSWKQSRLKVKVYQSLSSQLSSTSLFNSAAFPSTFFACLSHQKASKSTIIVEWSLAISNIPKSSQQTKQSKTLVKSFLTNYINWVLGFKTLLTMALQLNDVGGVWLKNETANRPSIFQWLNSHCHILIKLLLETLTWGFVYNFILG